MGTELSAGEKTGRRRSVVRTALAVLAVVALVGLGMLVPLPAAVTVRQWADSVGPWFPLLFLLVHFAVVLLPIPRTAFTAAAGFLFGPVLGFAICLGASTAAAAVAFLGVRHIDERHEAAVLHRIREHRLYIPIAARLRARGWLAVGSLRLIAAMPFSILNYVSALSPVRFVPYLLATIIGMAPGTAAVVLLGDALSGHSDPWLLSISAALFALGIVGLVVDVRRPVDTGR
ncbi:TVP38/TMEM64 family protein [Tsukamurella sp. 8F]|uniref:TVP38/TMEM64 family protein n=1 Tax=unclassified Tsukamurella TaxID=2633480 RepID=UPI0023BA2456|nr:MULTISPECIES: TVP38/TMEM64 family protein [unclassified Tsukamurella]MDF0529290.1 TVP38/TMEM64 family protein [Tsukamurella sp. 8J]MDF0586873.1 TVP38/TMEM64 family protein [Tsukamurella sp. 8F]